MSSMEEAAGDLPLADPGDPLARPVREEAPAGRSLVDDPALLLLEDALQGEPALFQGKEVVREAREPDWMDIRARAEELLREGRHLFVLTVWVTALTETEGWPGLRRGLAVLLANLERCGDHLDPPIDPEEPAAERYAEWASLLQPLATGIVDPSDPLRLLHRVRNLPLAPARRGSPFSYATLEAVRAGKEEASVEAAMNEAVLGRPPEELRGLQSEVGGALAAVRAIQRALAERIEEGCGPDLSPLEQILDAVREFLEEKEVSSRLTRNDESEESDPRPGKGGEAYGGHPAEGSPAVDRRLENRDEVDRVLRRVEEYFRQREPGSPNLLLTQRLRRYLGMDFLALIEDLHPESVEPLRNVTQGRIVDENMDQLP